MEIFNAAKHTVADVFTTTDKGGREYLVVVIKATYRIPANNQHPRSLVPAQPLIESDIYAGEPGYSAALYESDYVRYKIKCDVLFNASTYFTELQDKYQVKVKAIVSTLDKTLIVSGPRRWQKINSKWVISEPQYIDKISLHYGNAFGGEYIWYDLKGNKHIDVFINNIVGKGYVDSKNQASFINCCLPQVELLKDVVRTPSSRPIPGAFSVQPRNHPARLQYAGTYDEHWRNEVAPLLPEDFDERYFQCAPSDQQIDYPQGGEKVVLINMHKEYPSVEFRLPPLENIPVRILTMDYNEYKLTPVVDTLYFEPDEERFSVVWRTSVPLKRRIQEIHTVAIGAVGKAWWQQRAAGGGAGCGSCKDKQD